MAFILDLTQRLQALAPGADAATILLDAVLEAKQHEECTLRLPKGTYHIYPDRAFEKHYFISNNDEGLKRIAFPLIGCRNLTVDGGGADLIFHGKVVPFVVDGSQNVTISNLTIDYDRPFFTQGKILSFGENKLVLSIDAQQFPYKVENGQITFLAENWSRTGFENFLELDCCTRGPAYHVGDDWTAGKQVLCRELSPGVVEFQMEFARPHKPGNMMAISHVLRHVPGIFVSESRDVTVKNVTVYHAPAMAFIAQFTENITLKNYNVMLRKGTSRYISATADASHFVNCTGLITIDSCILEHQKDDPVNVHGINTVISRICDEHTIEVAFMHYEQNGLPLYQPGDRISILKRDSMLSYFHGTVTRVFPVNQNYVRLTLDTPVPAGCLNDAVENDQKMPELIIRGCRVGYNRARGFLITTNRKVLVEHNHIYSPGAGILIEGDANFWFESGAVQDVTIRENHFENCAISQWGQAAITINPSVAPEADGETKCHRNIRILSNRFDSFDGAIVWGHSVDGLTFQGNTVVKSDLYEPFRQVRHCIELSRCKNVTVRENTYQGFEESLTEFDG